MLKLDETDNYAWWRAALDGAQLGKDIPVHDGDPQCGFYRKRARKGGPFVPVAIFPHGDGLIGIMGTQAVNPEEVWTYCCQHPVTEQAYRVALTSGMWPDEDAHIVKEGPLYNADDFLETVAACEVGVSDYDTIENDQHAARAQSLRSKLLELHREADKLRAEEKAPHLAAGKAVDERWREPIQRAKNAADAIKRALGRFETARRKEAEENRTNEPPPDKIKGGYGRAASVYTVKVAKLIDPMKAYEHFMADDALLACVCKLGDAAARRGVKEIPGFEILEEQRVK